MSLASQMNGLSIKKEGEIYLAFLDYDNTQALTAKQKAALTFDNIRSALALKHLVEEQGFKSVHCTGRVDNQIIRDIESGDWSDLPFPLAAKTDIIISGVGTEVSVLNEKGEYVRDEEWRQKMIDTGFTEAVQSVLNDDGTFNQGFLDDVSTKAGVDVGLQGQEPDKQTEFKKSLWGNPVEKNSDEIRAAIVAVLEDRGINPDSFSITVSVQTSKTAVDLTPKGATKPEACEYVTQKIEAETGQKVIPLAGGDSRNDDHLRVEGYKAIMPANAQRDLIDAVYEAQPAENIYHDKNGKKAAAGTVAGIQHFGGVTEQQVALAYAAADAQLKQYPELLQRLEGVPSGFAPSGPSPANDKV